MPTTPVTSTCTLHQHMRTTPAHARYTSTCALHQHMCVTSAHVRYISTCVLQQHMRATPAHARYISTCALHQHMRATPAYARQYARQWDENPCPPMEFFNSGHTDLPCTLFLNMTDATFINVVYPPRGSGTVSSYSRTRV